MVTAKRVPVTKIVKLLCLCCIQHKKEDSVVTPMAVFKVHKPIFNQHCVEIPSIIFRDKATDHVCKMLLASLVTLHNRNSTAYAYAHHA